MRTSLTALVTIAALLGAAPPVATDANVTRATLENGLEVVIVRDTLAPVVSTVVAYRAGADEAPPDVPGLAHAQAHMAFRGCDGITRDQTEAIYAGLATAGTADAQQDVTQFETTVAASDLDVALHVDAACMRHIDDADAQWQIERPALEREVADELASPTYRAFARLSASLFAGTPYERDPLGTQASFEKITAASLARFAQTWYAPNDAVLVIAGDVDPAAVLASVRASFGSIPSHPLPPRAPVNLALPNDETVTLDSSLPYAVVDQGYRFPGSDDPDYAAGRVLADALGNPRNAIAAFAARGGALRSGFQFVANYPKASEAQAFAIVASGGDPKAVQKSLSALVAAGATSGVSADQVDEAKRSEIAAIEGARTSIPDLATAWSNAVAEEGRTSPDDDLDAIRAVTVADVDRVARRVLDPTRAATVILEPHPGAGPAGGGAGYGGRETVTGEPGEPVGLPVWAQTALARADVPDATLAPADMTLPNGLRLIVQPESASDTVTVVGSIEHDDDVQVARGKDGVGNVLADLFPYGTQSLDNAEFQKALDDAGASVSAGTDFSLRVAKANFERGVALLADDELHPALPAAEFRSVRRADALALATEQQRPSYLAQRALRRALLPANDPALREATPTSIATVSLEDVNAYRAAVYRPDATTIVVIGNVTPAEARTAIDASFGRWMASGPKPNVDLPPVPPNPPSTTVVPDRARSVDAAQLAETVSIRRADPAYAALQLGDRVLADAPGLAGDPQGALDASKSRATYSIAFASPPQTLAQTRRTIERTIAAMQHSAVSSSELQRAKGSLMRRSILAQTNESDVARDLIALAQAGLPLDETHRIAELEARLDANAVRAAFATYLRPNAFALVVRGPAPR